MWRRNTKLLPQNATRMLLKSYFIDTTEEKYEKYEQVALWDDVGLNWIWNSFNEVEVKQMKFD